MVIGTLRSDNGDVHENVQENVVILNFFAITPIRHVT